MRQRCTVNRHAARGAGFRRQLAVVNVAANTAAADAATTVGPALALLKEAARNASVAPKLVHQAMMEVEKQKVPCDDCVDYMSKPGTRWKLVYTSSPDAVTAAYKGDTKVSGSYFPMTAAWKYDSDPSIITYGIFLSSLAYFLFAGPFEMQGRKLEYDLTFMTLGLGPFKTTIPLKKDGAIVDIIARANGNENLLKKKMPFLLIAYADDDIMLARGSAGGVSMWVASDSDWQAKSGVLRIMQ